MSETYAIMVSGDFMSSPLARFICASAITVSFNIFKNLLKNLIEITNFSNSPHSHEIHLSLKSMDKD